MGVKFLSEEWAEEVTKAVNNDEAFQAAAGRHTAKIQNVVSTLEGEKKYFFTLEGGRAQLSIGEIEGPDATISQDYQTAMALAKSELSGTAAFMSGKVRVAGDLMKLMQMQGVFSTLPRAISTIDVEY
jgi:putative sterol carrier protein